MLQAEVLDPLTNTTLGTLAEETAKAFMDQLSDVGSGACVVEVDHADADLLVHENVVKLRDEDNLVLFAWKVEHHSEDLINEGDEATEVTVVTGRGILGQLDDVVLLPERGIGYRSPASRAMNFAAKAYPVDTWGFAYQVKQTSDAAAPYGGAPKDWPDPDSWWIWGQAPSGGTPPQPVGKCYFVAELVLPAQTNVRFCITGDDGYRLWVAGEEHVHQVEGFLWREFDEVDLLLDAGTYRVAIEGENITRDSAATNVAAVNFTAVELLDGGVLGSVLLRSDGTWRAQAYPPEPPTMTPSDIAELMLTEYLDNSFDGAAYNWAMGWSAGGLTDSNGDPWTNKLDLVLPVGITLTEVLRKMAATACEFSASYNVPALLLYNKPYGTDHTEVVLAVGGDAATVRGEVDAPKMNRALFQLPDGRWDTMTDITSQSAYGTKYAYVTLGQAASAEQANRMAAVLVSDSGYATATRSGVLDPSGDADTPYRGLALGDTVTAPGHKRVLGPHRLRAFACTEDDEGQRTWRVTYEAQQVPV